MALTSTLTKTIAHPSEEGVSFTIRKLSFAQLQEARDARLDAVMKLMRSVQGIELPQSAAEPVQDPGAELDRMTVLRHGVTAWSYEADLGAIVDLDEETALFLFESIVAFSVRSAGEVKASANGSPPSSDPVAAVGLPS